MTVFRIKSGNSIDSALHAEGDGQEVDVSSGAPEGTRLFVRRGTPTTPWWVTFFDANTDVKQQSNSGVAFIPIDNALFAVCFGHGKALLLDSKLDYEFGTRVALNMLDPGKLKSTDTLTPATAQRRQTQLPFDSDLSLLSFAEDETVLRSIRGKVKAEFEELTASVTGSQSVRISTPDQLDDLPKLLRRLQDLSNSDQFKEDFPEVGRITPISDPEIISTLDLELTSAIFNPSAPITLVVPDLIDESEEYTIQFSGAGGEEFFEDVYIKHYRQYLEGRGVAPQSLTAESLSRHSIRVLGPDFKEIERVSIYKSLVYSISDPSLDYSFHFNEGVWYRIADELVTEVRDYLDSFWIDSQFPNYNHSRESEYNAFLAEHLGMPCLDASDISPSGVTQVEPCDVFRLQDGSNEYIHVKIGTGSSTLSHLFNQGSNSIEFLRSSLDARAKFATLLERLEGSDFATKAVMNVTQGANKITFVIATHKRDRRTKSDLLPFFSRLSLRRQLRALQSMGVLATFQFVTDETDRAGRRKPRKKKSNAPSPPSVP
ncbi:DUF6119 family protein [Brachybacterium paraconglomeratum]|uniref:DUF6119 family protein n=1 Tax=Brachybacterium paraconglomeratum TaxID=173362 RepID=UPI0022AFA9A7|nr:DUF6119 family protein [Brachybacterium paraconglomeratum]MCZ4326798.1 TIGR04141 family sporadically distributed protein [Brachybacterium paraconglomeratum]